MKPAKYAKKVFAFLARYVFAKKRVDFAFEPSLRFYHLFCRKMTKQMLAMQYEVSLCRNKGKQRASSFRVRTVFMCLVGN